MRESSSTCSAQIAEPRWRSRPNLSCDFQELLNGCAPVLRARALRRSFAAFASEEPDGTSYALRDPNRTAISTSAIVLPHTRPGTGSLVGTELRFGKSIRLFLPVCEPPLLSPTVTNTPATFLCRRARPNPLRQATKAVIAATPTMAEINRTVIPPPWFFLGAGTCANTLVNRGAHKNCLKKSSMFCKGRADRSRLGLTNK